MNENKENSVALLIRRAWLRRKDIIVEVIFWLVLYFYYVSTAWPTYTDKAALFEKLLVKTGLQIVLSYVIISVLLPRLLHRKRRILFLLTSLASVYITYVLYTAYRHFYFDPKYPDIYKGFDFYDRILDANFFFTEISWFLFPVAILTALKYYRDQREVMSLREQKRITELKLLKNQLNPHFLFNTLNNLYVLALKKSDKTPELIAKLSAILDYMLYHCDDRYVALTSEIRLMNNYIDLEKIRYGDRVIVDFDYKIEKAIEIAPLILLTFLENAYKHGVKEEVGQARIQMKLRAGREEIFFEICNSKPASRQNGANGQTASIGLRNIKKQLDFLYPQRNWLEVEDRADFYAVTLKLKPHAISVPDH
ncbi:sensor histidine kinase [Flavilitoribacter nigricans]|uniref:Signal transduction histidine kinase internal region domain-containing protein n=1 Tax=Flavilitoribacter nigricans (strain ATCC 23147 / DSM 23189 / NBRC 102662 / NCIMB 1420 / SS-2) TaxID=1122177 RepID=A0A2D0N774_FLAN2|nr:sensor histidine kinase [Flavilitoribacter nigricans]PHN04317.1 hypothetical protein CRP01_22405 [Flavilitoribacter nigricans DSM 23189 = NBRC 102662]